MGAPFLDFSRLNDKELDFLNNLPKELKLRFPNCDPIYVTHQLPLSSEKLEEFQKEGIRDILSGHTHVVNNQTYDDFREYNPGSVGLGDNGEKGANYGVMTWKNGHLVVEKTY